VQLLIGHRYRVSGILHEYLGQAFLPQSNTVIHVFLRNEWRPGTADQLPVTIVEEAAVEETVTASRVTPEQ
jgi:hypothetical protein